MSKPNNLSSSVDQIKVYTDIQSMTGQGEEWLIDSLGEVRAVFIDGTIRCQLLSMHEWQEVTKVV
jgi:hypothetical protein